MTTKILDSLDLTNNNLLNPGNLYSSDTPAQHGMLEYNFPSHVASISNNLTAGRIYGAAFVAETTSTTGHIAVGLLSAAATPTTGQNLMGLYSISGTTATQIAITGDLGTWGSQGYNSYAWTASASLTFGQTYLVLIMSNATTPVHLGGLSSIAGFPAMYNANCSSTAAPWLRFFVQTSTGATALPASFVISGTTMSVTNALTPWVGLLV